MENKIFINGVIVIKLKNGKFIPFIRRGKFRDRRNALIWNWHNVSVYKKKKVLIDNVEELVDSWELEPYYHRNGKPITAKFMMSALKKAFDNPIAFAPYTIKIYTGEEFYCPKNEEELLRYLDEQQELNLALSWKKETWNNS